MMPAGYFGGSEAYLLAQSSTGDHHEAANVYWQLDKTVKDGFTYYVHTQTASRLLLKWLPFMQALQDTFVVIAIVFGTSVTLFAVNSVLADISKLLY